MYISLKGKRGLYKNELMMLEMLAECNWERPIYMAITVGSDNHLNLDPFFVQEGLAYRITPFNFQELGYVENPRTEFTMDSDRMYENLMNNYSFGGMSTPGIYLDETITRMAYTHRRLFVLTANQLVLEGKNDKALALLDKCERELPSYNLAHDFYMCYSHSMALDYIQLGQKEKGLDILCQMANKEIEYATWYLSLSDNKFLPNAGNCQSNINTLYRLLRCMEQADNKEILAGYTEAFERIYSEYANRVKS